MGKSEAPHYQKNRLDLYPQSGSMPWWDSHPQPTHCSGLLYYLSFKGSGTCNATRDYYSEECLGMTILL